MGINRRRFLLLSSLSGIGFAFSSCQLREHRSRSASLGESSSPPPAYSPQPDQALAAETSPPLLRFVSLADTGKGNTEQWAVARSLHQYYQRSPFPLVLLAGDNIYDRGEISKIQAVFEQPYAPLLAAGVKFRACLGNHDILTDNGDPQVAYPGFNMDGRYYDWRQGPVHFFALDTNRNADWPAQLTWLDPALERSNAPWKIVFGHHTLYSSGRHGSNPELIAMLAPLFQRHRVQVYINGHDHTYERTHPIQGTTYITSGGGGAPLYPVGRSEWTAYSASVHNFVAYEVFADRLQVQAINTDGQVFDRATIAR